jgi:hypothetical protein
VLEAELAPGVSKFSGSPFRKRSALDPRCRQLHASVLALATNQRLQGAYAHLAPGGEFAQRLRKRFHQAVRPRQPYLKLFEKLCARLTSGILAPLQPDKRFNERLSVLDSRNEGGLQDFA